MDSIFNYQCTECGKTIPMTREEFKLNGAVCDECRSRMEGTNSANGFIFNKQLANDIVDTAEAFGRRIKGELTFDNTEKHKDKFDKTDEDDNVSEDGIVMSEEPRDLRSIVSRIANDGASLLSDFLDRNKARNNRSGGKNDDLGNNWECIGILYDAYANGLLTKYNKCAGLYMHKLDGQIMYIGRAVEYYNGGIRKRLSDYCRPNGSARKHPSGRLINEHCHEITTYVMPIGSDEEAKLKTIELEKVYIRKYNPPWNDKFTNNF